MPTTITLDAFGGLDLTPDALPGTLIASENLNPTGSPHLATRTPIITLCRENRLLAFSAVGDRLCYLTEDRQLVLLDPDGGDGEGKGGDGEPHRYPVTDLPDIMPTRVLPFYEDLFIAPGLLFSPETGATVPLEAHWRSDPDTAVTFSLCRPDGTPYLGLVAADHVPSTPVGGSHWLDTAARPHALYVFRESDGKWALVTDTCLRIGAPGIGLPFYPGDSVTLHGLAPAVLAPLEDTVLPVRACGPDHLVLPSTALPVGTLQQTATLLVHRPLPTIDRETVLSAMGRLWVWEQTDDGAALRACALGDPTNWYGEDALTVPLPNADPVTAAVAHKGTLYFFTACGLYRVTLTDGGRPRLRACDLPGVPVGFGRAVATLDDDIYYLSLRGVMRLGKNDTAPTCVSTRLHPLTRTGVSLPTAGAADGTYYLTLSDGEGVRTLTYRPEEDTWQSIPHHHFYRYARVGEVLYAHELSDPARIVAFDPPPAMIARCGEEELFPWSATVRAPLPETLPCRPTRLELDLIVGDPEVLAREEAALEGLCEIEKEVKREYMESFPRPRLEIDVQINETPWQHLKSVAPGTVHLTLPLGRAPTYSLRVRLRGRGFARVTGMRVTTM